VSGLARGASAGTGSTGGTYSVVAVYRSRRASTAECNWKTRIRTPMWIATLPASEVDLDRGAGRDA